MNAKNKKQKSKSIGRREFVTRSAAVATGLTILPFGIISAKGRIAPSDKLNIAGIGVGGMAEVKIEIDGDSFSIGNEFIQRDLTITDGSLKTVGILNKRLGKTLKPLACDEFSLRISQGTHIEGTDKIITAEDFFYVSHSKESNSLSFLLSNKEHGLDVTVRYELADEDNVLRKKLEIKASKEICVERIDIEAIAFHDAYQPYTIKQITANAKSEWRPGLGQPLFTTDTATFWGVEFPASYNFVKDSEINCGYLYGHILKPGQSINTYKAVVGVGDNTKYISETFYDYITKIRIRPLRLQLQYNSWFDYRISVNRETFKASVDKINNELCVERGVRPFSAYVIDSGWQDSRGEHCKNWADGVWPVSPGFDSDFKRTFATIKEAKSDLGLWMSPGCNFGSHTAIPNMRKAKMGALSNWMSLANTKYMDMLEKRMVELTDMGVTYFKLDGCFGHLKTRDFDIDGAAHGVPTMPQLGTKGWRTDDERLNDSKYDELKSYYLTVGTERMIKIFKKMAVANPEVYIVISNGAYLSPWWLMYCDAVWMINASDAASGARRTDELVYRDNIYHDIWVKEKTLYPMNSLFNHEPKKTQSLETKDTFRKYLYMNMSRGTGFVELYLETFKLKNYDWDVLAEGLLWVEDVFPTFERVRMHGGRPESEEVYGFTSWIKDRGYISIHNPADKEQKYTITLDRDLGLIKGTDPYYLTSPLADSLVGLKKQYKYGDTITITLKPYEIRILNFDDKPKDWSELVALQTRTADDFEGQIDIPIEEHPMIGKWSYTARGKKCILDFRVNKKCVYTEEGKKVWTKKFEIRSPDSVECSGDVYTAKGDNTMDVGGLYTAQKEF